MRVLVDTNVILDVLCNRAGFAEDSQTVINHCEIHTIEGFVSALSFPNIVYILRKELTPAKTKEVIDKLSLIFQIADLKAADLKNAAELQFPDFEDGLQSVCASRIKAQYIVTRNIRDFSDSRVPAIKPSELLERI